LKTRRCLLALVVVITGAIPVANAAAAQNPTKPPTQILTPKVCGPTTGQIARRIASQQGRRPGSKHAGKVIARRARATASARARHKATRNAVSFQPRVPAVRGGLPNVQALGALVLDENGRELYARNPDHERPIASISKLAATLVVVDRNLEMEGLSTITRADTEVARGGARSRLLEGLTLSNRDLLHAALLGSDNRAIPALGRAVRLSPSQLAAAMTAKAKALGLVKTRFHDPTGLSIQNVSTPRETIALLRAVMRSPVLGPIIQRIEYEAHPIGKPPISYVNTFRPAVRSNVQVLGGKTGYNDDARYCLVLAARVDGHTCYMSFLSSEGKLTRFGDVARVADWIVSRKPRTVAAAPAAVAEALPARTTPKTTPPGPLAPAASPDETNPPEIETAETSAPPGLPPAAEAEPTEPIGD
jgi:D-alanyl-D-alanine endopeptidase (penicillin-binding protein 7)